MLEKKYNSQQQIMAKQKEESNYLKYVSAKYEQSKKAWWNQKRPADKDGYTI